MSPNRRRVAIPRKRDVVHQIERLRLTDEGSGKLEGLSELHLEELAHLAPTMHAMWDALERGSDGAPRRMPHPAGRAGSDAA